MRSRDPNKVRAREVPSTWTPRLDPLSPAVFARGLRRTVARPEVLRFEHHLTGIDDDRPFAVFRE